MIEAYYPFPSMVALREVSEPEINNPNEVKVKIKYIGICDDDLCLYRGDTLSWPLPNDIVGHEYSGYIVEVGENAKRYGFKIGDFVSGYAWNFCGNCYYCKSGMESHCENIACTSVLAEYVILNIHQICKIPDHISPINGVFFDAIGYCSYNAFKNSNFGTSTQVLIMGANNFAFILLQLLKNFTGAEVSLTDNNLSKLDLALQLGADHTFTSDITTITTNMVRITDDHGYNYIFDMSRNPQMLSIASVLSAVRGDIRYSYLYEYNTKNSIGFSDLYMKEATLTPFYLAQYNLYETMSILSKLSLEPLITAKYPLEKISDAYKEQSSAGAIKTIIEF